MFKALILAAGSGKRMGKYGLDKPKGLLEFNGRSLIEWQLQQFRKQGIKEIAIVTGYHHELIQFPDIQYFHNPKYAETNMLESLMAARNFLTNNTVISYADIIFDQSLLKKALAFSGDIGISVDTDWRGYWQQRYNDTECDLESLDVKQGKICSLGKPVDNSSGIEYRYVGLNVFSITGLKKLLTCYDHQKNTGAPWPQSGKPFLMGYMTDLINEIIKSGQAVLPIVNQRGWFEFDTAEDFETMQSLLTTRKIPPNFFN